MAMAIFFKVKISMNNVLVIGGCGFIGSNLCRSLNDLGINVTSYDNYFTGFKDNHISGVSYIEGESKDINNYKFSKSFDHIFHLGEYSRVERSFDDIDTVFEYNLNSIYSVMKFVKKNNAKLIYGGSSTKFGDDGSNAFESPYAFTKKVNSELVETYCSWFNINYAIAYFYNVYGENEIATGDYSTVIAKFLRLKFDGAKNLPVTLPGTQKRNFTYIDDITNGLILIAKDGFGDGYGIGNDESFSIIDLAQMMNLEIEYMPEKKGNRMVAEVKNEKLKKLGWKAKTSLRDYVKRQLTNV